MSKAQAWVFDEATTGVRVNEHGAHSVELSPAWTVGDKPNGGYLAAVLARAAAAEIANSGGEHSDCVAASTTFFGAPDSTNALVDVTILRQGRGATQVRATLLQGGIPMTEAMMTFASLEGGSPRLYDVIDPVGLPPVESCIRISADTGSGFTVSIMNGTEVHMDPATMDWTRGISGGGVGELRGWVQFADGRPIDALSLQYLIDCFPPATFPLASVGWVPTVQLTCYVRSLPAPGPVRIRQRVQVIEGGFVDEVCEIWDATGKLVAHGTQLAKVRFEIS